MASRYAPADAHDLIEQEVKAYRESLPPPDPAWPPDIRVVYVKLHEHLFDEELRIGDLLADCGIGDHNIATHFACFLGRPPKSYVIKHRVSLVKRLLQISELRNVRILRISYAVGYSSSSALAQAFKKYQGCSPARYRKKILKKNIKN